MSKEVVKCKAGNFLGKKENGINFYYGIPFAKPLSNKSQWHPPEKINSAITHEAIKPGSSAPQTVYRDSFLKDSTMPPESIDCLSLNIASRDINGNMPVMIWIHGGGYLTGSSNSIVYDLDYLPLHNVVVVSINYRLGPLGFLKLDEVTNGRIGSTGNEGLMDQKLAIEWVKENINEFGGNPDNITLFGQSAGAWSVALQASISPEGKLFSKAICQSGGMNAFFHKDRANEWGELFIKNAFDKGFDFEDLLSMPHYALTKLATNIRHTMIAKGSWLSPEVGFAPVADGVFLPEDPLKNFQDSPIKLVIGTTEHEYRLWSDFESYYINLTEEEFFRRLNKIFIKEAVSSIVQEYLKNNSSGNKYKDALSDIMTDWTFGIHALELLEQNQNHTYGYFFNEISPVLDGKLGAYHASELPYVFGSAKKQIFKDFCSANHEKITNFFQISWTQFAKTGSPASELLDWKPYKEKSVAIINSKPSIKKFRNIDRIKLLHVSKKN